MGIKHHTYEVGAPQQAQHSPTIASRQQFLIPKEENDPARSGQHVGLSGPTDP